MTQREFIYLHEAGRLDNVTVWACDVKDRCGGSNRSKRDDLLHVSQ